MAWVMVGGAAISIGSSIIGGRKAGKAASKQEALQRRINEGVQKESQNWGREYTARAGEIRNAYAPLAATNVDTGFATTAVDPATGMVSSALSAPWAAQRDMFLDQSRQAGTQGTSAFNRADAFFKQAGDFNPQTFAADRYRAGQALLQPGRTLGQQGLMQDLMNKGGFGLTLNQPAEAGADASGNVIPGVGSVGVNPYVSTFLNANNRADAEMGYGSLREGQTYLDQILSRGNQALSQGTGMFGLSGQQSNFGQGIQARTLDALNQSGMWSDRATQARNLQNQAYYDNLFKGIGKHYQGEIGYYTGQAGLDPGASDRRVGNMISQTGGQIGGGMMGGSFSLPKTMFPSLGGGAAGGGQPASSAYNLMPWDTNPQMFPGQG